MKYRENPVYGRKIFFLNPPFNIRKLVISRLQELEYEVYYIEDYRDAKNILRHYPDSICFMSIDNNYTKDQLTFNQWFNFVHSFADDLILKTIYIGILAGRVNQSEKNFFMLHTAIPAGFISTNESTEDLVETLAAILDINGAKGRRQYIRVTCPSSNLANLKCNFNKTTYILPILNISSVGLACEISIKEKNIFLPNSLLRDMTIRLNGNPIVCSAAVFSIKQLENKIMLILLLLKGTPYTIRQAIRRYIFRTLRTEMISKIEGEQPDTTVYTDKIELQDKDAFLIDANETVVTEEAGQNETASPNTHTLTTLF